MKAYTAITPKTYTIEEIADLFENDDEFSFNRVDNIVIQFGTTFKHLGRICYKGFKVSSKNNLKLSVDLNSIDLVATRFASKLIPYLADLMLDGKRTRTLSDLTSYVISLFKYIRENELDLLCNKASIQNFVNHYTD